VPRHATHPLSHAASRRIDDLDPFVARSSHSRKHTTWRRGERASSLAPPPRGATVSCLVFVGLSGDRRALSFVQRFRAALRASGA